MNVSSIQQVNLMDCCGCAWPTCPEPVKECQSFFVNACGVQLPTSELVPLSDQCTYYKTITTKRVVTDTYTGPLPEGASASGTQVEENLCVFKYEFRGPIETRSCEFFQFSTAYTLESDITNYFDGDETEQTIVAAASGSEGEGPCEGSITTTVNYPDEPGEPVTEPLSSCECVPFLDITQENVVYEDGAFNLIQTEVISGESHLTVQDLIYSDPVTLADLITEGEARAALYGAEIEWPGGSCVARIEYIHTYDDPEESPVCTQVSSIIYHRYRWTVPSEWIGTRSVLELTWLEVFFPEVWDEWDDEVAIYEESLAAHQAWIDGGSVGPEPEVPDEPGPEPEDKPVVVAEKEWIWDAESEQSEWFVMGFPPDPGIEGEIRTVNLAVNCWNSTRLGRKPSWYGEIYTPPETP